MKRLSMALSLSLLLCACGSSSSDNDGGTLPVSDAGPGSDAGSTDAGSDAGTPQDGGPQDVGAILFGTGSDAGFGSSWQLVGGFEVVTGSASPVQSPCGAMINGCQFCTEVMPGDGGSNVTVTSVSGGTLTASDGASTLLAIPYDPNVGEYIGDSAEMPSLVWNPGDTLTASTDGGVVPAFTASIEAPQLIQNLTPTPSLLSPTTISLSQNFLVTWTPGSDNATFQLVLSNNKINATIGCTVAESSGQFNVDKSLLANFSGATGGTIGVTKSLSKNITAGSFNVSVTARGPDLPGSVNYTP